VKEDDVNEQEANQLVQRMYDNMFSTLTGSPDGGAAAYDPNKTFLTLTKRGQLINPLDFGNQWSPGNLDGSTDATQNFADLVDDIPNFSPVHTSSARRVSEMYQQLLRATVTADASEDPTKRKAYLEAQALLTQEITDEETGKKKVVASDLANDYDANQTAWRSANVAFMQAYLAAMASPETKRTWPMMAPQLAGPVHQAYQKWRTGKADQVEGARATLMTSGVDQVKRAFSDAQELFDGYVIGTGGGAAVGFTRRSTALPSDWYTSAGASQWPIYNFEYTKTATNTSSDFTSYGGRAGFSLGLWSVGGGAGGTDEQFHSDASVENVQLSYRWALVNIKRAWFQPYLFGLPHWKTDVAKRGQWSSGTRVGQDNTQFSLLPTAFMAVRDVTVRANFSKAEVDRINKSINAGASVGWGPFSISGSYSHSHREEHVRGEFGQAGFKMPGVQIVGWINQILPFCPPEG
jgi:hypothetical protein